MTPITPTRDTHPALFGVFDAWAENGVALDDPSSFQPNCFSSWCAGYDAGQNGIHGMLVREYARGMKAARQDFWFPLFLLTCAGFILGVVTCASIG